MTVAGGRRGADARRRYRISWGTLARILRNAGHSPCMDPAPEKIFGTLFPTTTENLKDLNHMADTYKSYTRLTGAALARDKCREEVARLKAGGHARSAAEPHDHDAAGCAVSPCWHDCHPRHSDENRVTLWVI